MNRLIIAVIVSFAVGTTVYAESSAQGMKEDKQHVLKWNEFAAACKEAHEKIIETNDIVQSEKSGGYPRNPDFYREVTYTDKKTGLVYSRVKWEKDDPKNEHVMELFYYDDKGRVKRDYTTAFLPGFRNAPVQTLIALHAYNKDLHAFRSFDADGVALYEHCEGTFKGENIDISYEDDEIDTMRLKPKKGEMAKPIYKACFDEIPLTVGKYIKP
jgi:hypothetical protein